MGVLVPIDVDEENGVKNAQQKVSKGDTQIDRSYVFAEVDSYQDSRHLSNPRANKPKF